MKKLLFIAILFSTLNINAQSFYCGTVDDGSIARRLKANKKAIIDEIQTRTDYTEWFFIPVEFHIVTKSDGTGGIDENDILDELDHINKNYAGFKMKFYLASDFNYIKSNSLYSDPGGTFGVSKIKSNKKKYPNAINIFLVNKMESGDSPGSVLGYYTPQLDVVVIRNNQFGIKAQTASHELGHFFSLQHTFHGWESDPYDPVKHGNPVNILKTSTGQTIEFMDKSNCEIAADLLCDTPPDYNFGIFDPEQDCKLNGPILDYHHDTIVTMENNYMSYFFRCGDYQFTPMQIAAMRADFSSSARKFLRIGIVPDTTTIDASNFHIVYPENNEKVEYYDYVDLDWDDVPNATHYLVTVTPKSHPQSKKKYFVKGESHLRITNLLKGKKYQWYVRPYSNAYTGISKLGGYNFRAGDWTSGIYDLSDTAEINIYPNPVNEGVIFIKSTHSFKNVVVEIYDMNGKQADSYNMNLIKGINKLNLTHSNYQNAMYNVVIKTKEHNYIRKVFYKK